MGDTGADSQLVERVQRGDKKAFDLLVLKYQHRILKLISRYVRDPSDAMDVAQDAFLKAYRSLPNFRGDSAFYTWIYRIAVNTAKNHLVAQSRRPLETDPTGMDGEAIEPAALLKDYATPENYLITEEIQEAIATAIDQLPEDLRTAITLREIEGLSYEEIAEVMTCPIGTVRSRIFRAREAIDHRLKPYLE
ncbi:MAG: RNA polymerase sigma factor RpoE [Pseudomonadota bacterium]|jgi:RNA polymerase sigma-70 factor (ECF subfamily)|nr:RNA polymerase sigma factor RpoE [Gammaproteobacteria bacterium]MDQ3583170.1 RNA polymerase sigma factor RpoE [Pseudomonadota bacterium]